MLLLMRALLFVGVLLSSALASATPLTLTFDTGSYDDSNADYSGELHGHVAWIENGARIQGFWAVDAGTPSGHYQQGHLNLTAGRPQDTGVLEAAHSWTDDLEGLIITLENGGTFDLISIGYRVTELERPDNPKFQRLPWSYDATDPRILSTTSFDPALADFEGQWTASDTLDVSKTFSTLYFTDLDNLTSVMISQTAAYMWLDNIVIDVHQMTPIPEPSTALLLGLGFAVLARRRR